MAQEQRIGIRMTVDAASAHAELPRVGSEFQDMGNSADKASKSGSESVGRMTVSITDLVKSAAGLSLVVTAVRAVTDAVTSLPKSGFDFTRELEVAQMGMAGVLGSMTAINGKQTTWNQGLSIAQDIIAKLNDDALRTAATSQELVGVFQALLAPGLAAGMNLDQIRQLTVVGTNAVKSIGLQGYQVVQELRDLVSGGITTAGSQLASSLGLRDADIAKAKGSAEGLFLFLMGKLKGFKAAADEFNNTITGAFAGLEEGATRVASAGMRPLTQAIKQAVIEASNMFVTFDKAGNAQLNGDLVAQLQGYAAAAVQALRTGKDVVTQIWDHRDAVVALASAYGAFRIGQWGSELQSAAAAQLVQIQALRLARVEEAAGVSVSQQAVLSSQQKVAALLAELEAQRAATQGQVAAMQAQVAAAQAAEAETQARTVQLRVTVQAIELNRADVLGKMENARVTLAQAQAQLQAAQSAGALSFAIAMRNEALQTLDVTQARHAALMTELATLGQQQTRVNEQIAVSLRAEAAAAQSVVAAQEAVTMATQGAAAATGRLEAAQAAATGAATAGAAAMRGMSAVVAALGGPVGIAITAIAAMGIAMYNSASAAKELSVQMVAIRRLQDNLAAGKTPEYGDIGALQSRLSDLRKQRDEMMAAGKTQLERHGLTLKQTNELIAEYSDQLKKAQSAEQNSANTSRDVTLTVDGTRQAWMKANTELQTSANIQDTYNQKLQASKTAYAQYVEQLKKTGATPKALADAAARQAENEKALATERDKALQSLGAQAGKVASALTKLDLEGIRAKAQATESAINNAQQVLEAQHAAGLVEDATYYQARKLLMQQMAQAQTEELQAENQRLAAQKLKGQEALDRDRQIAVNSRKIAQEQADASTKGLVIELQATAAVRARTAATLAARQAAEDYLATQQKQQDRDLAAVGQGSRQRNLNTALSQIEDKYSQQRRDLENNRAQAQLSGRWTAQQEQEYQDRLALINEFQAKALGSYRSYYEQLGVLQSDWKAGAAEALADYADQAANVAEGTKTLFTDALGGIEDVFVDLATKGKASFSDLATSILADIVRIEARIAISAAAQYIANAIGFSFGASSGGAGTVSGGSGLTFKANALGDVYRSHSLSAYSGQVVNRPTLFAFAAGAGLMGEAGPEGIFPLKRNSAGQLGVVATPAPQQAQQPTVTVNNYMGQDAQASVTQDDQGNIRIDFERRVLATVAGDMAAGGQTARATAGRMGLNNGATVRRRRG